MRKIEMFAGVSVCFKKDGKKYVEFYPKMTVFDTFNIPDELKTELIRALIIIYPESVKLEDTEGIEYHFKLIAPQK